jgi:hypothetical protein
MSSGHDLWSVFHFSKLGPSGQVDILLRAVADHLNLIGPVEVCDITFRLVPTEEGDDQLPEMTVYYDRPT